MTYLTYLPNKFLLGFSRKVFLCILILILYCFIQSQTSFKTYTNILPTPQEKADQKPKFASENKVYPSRLNRNDTLSLYSDLPYCQRNDHYITFHDVNPRGSGYFHKLVDFENACEIAIKTNRTIVDFTASFMGSHAGVQQHDSQGNPLHFVLGWTFGMFMDLNQFVYAFDDKQGSRLCRLRFITTQEIRRSEPKSVINAEFGVSAGPKFCPEKLCNYRTRDIVIKNFTALQNTYSVTEAKKVGKQDNLNSQFVNSTAKYIAEYLKRTSIFIANQKFGLTSSSRLKLAVFKLRGTDRPCALLKINELELIKKIESFGISKERYIVYLMTDLNVHSKHVRALRTHFEGYFLFESRDIPIFKHEQFVNTGSYLKYVVELQLMGHADIVIESDFKVKAPNYSAVKILAPKSCRYSDHDLLKRSNVFEAILYTAYKISNII